MRGWLVEQGYKGEGPPSPLPEDVRCEAARRYIEAFEPSIEEPMAWIRRNLGNFSSEKFDNSERS